MKEGARTYRYGYLDQVLSVTEGKMRTTYGYHVYNRFSAYTTYFAQRSGELANAEVYAWFEGNKTWRAVNVNSTSWSKWIKKGEDE